ncbi:MAG: agmatine deiminase family protein [Oscillospiraceae bacterium]
MASDKSFIMPAEWEAHARTLMEWCVRDSVVYPALYAETCAGYAEVVRAISEFEPVTLVVNPADLEQAKNLCGAGVDYVEIPHSDAWARDNGPTFVRGRGGEIAGISWRFNAWGERFTPYGLDDAMAGDLLQYLGIPMIESGLILEGGSIHSDGAGKLLTTAQCLLNKNRNPQLSKAQIEAELHARLGADTVIWLENGLDGDETDGHVDNLACFSKAGTVLLQTCADKSDANFAVTESARGILSGAGLEIIPIEQPPARCYGRVRLTLSYLNFYLVNGGVILPVFGGDARRTDDAAAAVLREAFPSRKICTVDGMKLVREGGNVHCITQQMPV